VCSAAGDVAVAGSNEGMFGAAIGALLPFADVVLPYYMILPMSIEKYCRHNIYDTQIYAEG
jgi:hypothetical protein